jgi:hypothetical protein
MSLMTTLKDYLFPKTVAQIAREETMRLRSVERQIKTERMGIQREIQCVERDLRAAASRSNEALVSSLSCALAGLRDKEAESVEEETNTMLMRYRTSDVKSMSMRQGMIAGHNRLVAKQTRTLNPTAMVAQQKRITNNVEQLKKGKAALNETIKMATGVKIEAGSSAEKISIQAMEMQADALAMQMAQAPNAGTGLANNKSVVTNEDEMKERVFNLPS